MQPVARAARVPGVGVPAVLTEAQVRRRGPAGRLLAVHPWIGDAGIALAVLLVGLVTSEMARETVQGSTGLGLFPPGGATATRVVTAWLVGAAAGAALLLVRRVSPMGVTAALTALALVSLSVAGVLGVLGACLAVALHSVASARPARTAWLTCGAVLVVVSVVLWRWQQIGLAEMLLWSDPMLAAGGEPARQLTEPPFSPGRRATSVTLLLALLVLGVATGSAARARRLHAQDLVARYEAMSRERDKSAALARAAERARIARELHDVVAHSVSVMVALSDGASAALDRAPASSRVALAELSHTGRSALTDMQRLLGALDPEDTDAADTGPDGLDPESRDRPEPPEPDLAAIVDRFRAAGVPVTASGLDTALPDDVTVRLAVARVVTEGLTNVLRHAPGTPSASVTVRRRASAVEVEVLDAGGTRPGTGSGSHRGILGMRERAALLGGHVEAGPRTDGGWRVLVVLPCGDRDDVGPA